MRVTYDPEVDILYMRLNEAPIADSESVDPNLILDRDAENNIVGVEIMGLSQLVGAKPRTLTFDVRETAQRQAAE
jgi:uncharacterized protein YuzE